MKTHKVIDLFYPYDEGQVFAGTHEECLNFKFSQGFGYKIVPMTKEEIENYPDNIIMKAKNDEKF